MTTALGIDIGGTKIEGSLVHADGSILATLREPAPLDNEAMLARIVDMVTRLSEGHAVSGVGFSIPGSLDERGVLRNAPNSPAIEGTRLQADLARRLGLPTAFENDANCLAVSERAFGAARGYDHVVGIILGTGVGGGVITAGRLFRGWRGLAPEPGHLPLKVDGRTCLCGNTGCAEAYLSGPSVLRRYHDAGGSPDITDTRALFERAHDPLAAEIIAETARLFVRFAAALVSLYDPQIMVLGGGLSLQPLFCNLDTEIGAHCFGTREAPRMVRAQCGDASGKLGAAALIFDGAGRRPPG